MMNRGGMNLGKILEALDPGRLRYGVSTAEKEAIARRGELPGAPVDRSAGQEKADRYAAGFLFAKEHPDLAPILQPMVDRLKTSDLPYFGGESPEVQSYASQGMTRALAERGREQPQGMSLGALLAMAGRRR